jgi:hypothetical protein
LSIGVYRLNDAKESLAYLRAASKQPGYSKVERMTPPTVLKPGFRLIKPRAWTYLVQSGRYVVEVKAAFDKERPSRKQRYEVGRSAGENEGVGGAKGPGDRSGRGAVGQAAAGKAAYALPNHTA